MCQLRSVLAASMVVILLSVSMAPAAVVISDTFTLTAERTAGQILTGQTTEVGGVQWLGETSNVGYYYFLTPDGKVNQYRDGDDTSGSGMMGVPYEVNPAGEIVTVSADITWAVTAVPTKNASGVGFLPDGVGFDDAQKFYNETSLGVFIYETGRWKLFVQDLGQAIVTVIDSDTSTEYPALDPLTASGACTENVKVSYDTLNNTCNVWFGAQQLVTDLDLSDKNPDSSTPWAPDIAYGCFGIPARGDMPDNRVDNFLMESTNPIPEPMTLSLLLAGGGVLFTRKRK